MPIMEISISILPVLFFLVFLFLLDSFKLVVNKILLLTLLWGVVGAGLSYVVNSWVLDIKLISFQQFSQYIAPAIEELLKALLVMFLLHKKRIGFMIDAAIYGFAIGAGFSLVENIFYLSNTEDANLLIWIIRGFGTALMHGGCTSLFAVIFISGQMRGKMSLLYLAVALLVAYLIHSLFNHFYISPIIQTAGIVVILPLLFMLIFRFNETQLQDWLEIEFSNEVELLNMINKGQFTSTKAGTYLATLKTRFTGEVILDMYCYVQTYLDLSIKAKRNLMLKESGFDPIIEPDVNLKLQELQVLRAQIGKVGELTLAPLIRMNYRDLWKLNTLK